MLRAADEAIDDWAATLSATMSAVADVVANVTDWAAGLNAYEGVAEEALTDIVMDLGSSEENVLTSFGPRCILGLHS